MIAERSVSTVNAGGNAGRFSAFGRLLLIVGWAICSINAAASSSSTIDKQQERLISNDRSPVQREMYVASSTEIEPAKYVADRERSPPNNRFCYGNSSSTIVFLQVTNRTDRWNPVEMCAIKSAAVFNPDAGVCVLTVSPMKMHRTLAGVSNLEFAALDPRRLLADTPLESWYREYATNERVSRRFLTWELSDALRYAYLYKYGGKYMDTDSLTLRSLSDLRNVIGWHDRDLIGNGVMFFDRRHPFVGTVLRLFNAQFKPGVWGAVGPALLTMINNRELVDPFSYDVLPPSAFYPIPYQNFTLAFAPERFQYVRNKTVRSYTLHLYNAMLIKKSGNEIYNPKPDSFVGHFIRNVCS